MNWLTYNFRKLEVGVCLTCMLSGELAVGVNFFPSCDGNREVCLFSVFTCDFVYS